MQSTGLSAVSRASEQLEAAPADFNGARELWPKSSRCGKGAIDLWPGESIPILHFASVSQCLLY
jgi:hypothetical protein